MLQFDLIITINKEDINNMILSLENLTKKYDKNTAIDNISIEVKHGVNALLGVNGAGKTTLMKLIVNTLKPTCGHIFLDKKDILENEKSYRNIIGFLPQDFRGYPEFTAEELMHYIGKLKNLKDNEIKDRTNELLKLVSLSDLKNKKIKTFSGGMKRRLGIAQALLNDPKVLLLDEPTAGLDPKERIKFRNIISNLGTDKIIILSTHIISDVENIATNLIVMKKGGIFLNGSSEEIVNKLNGKVWEYSLSSQEACNIDDLEGIGNFKVEKDSSVIVRGLSNTIPHPKAYQVEAKVEDIFLNYFVEDKDNEFTN